MESVYVCLSMRGEDTTSTSEPMSAADLTNALRRMLLFSPERERIPEALRMGHAALDGHIVVDDPLAVAYILTQYYANAGAFGDAHAVVDRVLEIIGDNAASHARAMFQRATILHRERRLDEAVEILERLTIEVSPERQPKLRGRLLNLFAGICDAMGDLDRAEELFAESYALREQTNDAHGLAITAYNIGLLHLRRDERDQAMQHFLRALELQRANGETANVADTLCYIGLLHARQGHGAEALRAMDEAVDLASTASLPTGRAVIYGNRARMYKYLGDERAYVQALEDALAHAQSLPYPEITDALRVDVAAAYVDQLRFDEAERILDLTLQGARANTLPYVEINALQVLGTMRRRQHRLDEAIVLMEQVVHKAHALRMQRQALDFGAELAVMLRDVGRDRDAIELLMRLIDQQRDIAKNEFDTKIDLITKRFDRERRVREAEIERLRNVELSSANQRLQQMNDDLRILADEKDEFLAIAAHDLRNPLSEMRQTLLDVVQHLDPDVAADAVTQLRDVRRTVTRMIDTVRAFLDVSRSDRSGMHLDTVDARHLLNRAVERHSNRARVKCITMLCTAPGDLDLFATGDAPIIDAILDNLISNALKYSPSESTVTLTAARNGNDVCLIVRDQGPGIPEDERTHLFTKHPGISTQPTGGEESLGLGLYLAARMARRIDARIAHSTPPDGGAEFTLCMRAANPL